MSAIKPEAVRAQVTSAAEPAVLKGRRSQQPMWKKRERCLLQIQSSFIVSWSIDHYALPRKKEKNQHILQSVMQPNVSGHLNRPTFREHGQLFCITLSWPIKTESVVRHETYHGIEFWEKHLFICWEQKEAKNYKSISGLKVTPEPVQTSCLECNGTFQSRVSTAFKRCVSLISKSFILYNVAKFIRRIGKSRPQIRIKLW